MNAVLTGIKNEIFKIFSKKKFALLFLLSIFITLSVVSANLAADKRLGGPILNYSTIPVTVLDFLTSAFLPLFILMLTSDLFSGEFSDNSIVLSLVRPITRSKLYISKIIAMGVGILILLFGTFVLSELASLMGGNINSCLIKLPSNFTAYVSAFVPMFLIAVITAFAAQFTKNGSLIVVIMVLSFIIISAASIIFPEIKPFVPTTYLTWHKNFYSNLNISKIVNELLYMLGYGIIFMFTGSYLFYRRDI